MSKGRAFKKYNDFPLIWLLFPRLIVNPVICFDSYPGDYISFRLNVELLKFKHELIQRTFLELAEVLT